jgi:hypothetical protein
MIMIRVTIRVISGDQRIQISLPGARRDPGRGRYRDSGPQASRVITTDSSTE